MKMTRCLMDEVTIDLIRMTPFGVGDSAGNHLQPIVANFSQSVPKFGSGLVSSTHTIVSFHEGFLCLFVKGKGVGFLHVTDDIMFVLSRYNRIGAFFS